MTPPGAREQKKGQPAAQAPPPPANRRVRPSDLPNQTDFQKLPFTSQPPPPPAPLPPRPPAALPSPPPPHAFRTANGPGAAAAPSHPPHKCGGRPSRGQASRTGRVASGAPPDLRPHGDGGCRGGARRGGVGPGGGGGGGGQRRREQGSAGRAPPPPPRAKGGGGGDALTIYGDHFPTIVTTPAQPSRRRRRPLRFKKKMKPTPLDRPSTWMISGCVYLESPRRGYPVRRAGGCSLAQTEVMCRPTCSAGGKMASPMDAGGHERAHLRDRSRGSPLVLILLSPPVYSSAAFLLCTLQCARWLPPFNDNATAGPLLDHCHGPYEIRRHFDVGDENKSEGDPQQRQADLAENHQRAEVIQVATP